MNHFASINYHCSFNIHKNMIFYQKGSVYMRCLFIINPSSGTKQVQRNLDRLIGKMVLKQIVSTVDVFYTQKKDDAYYRTLTVRDSDYDFIVSVGGDGTVNEIISGYVEANLSLPIVIIPGGTVNDFANHFHLPTHNHEIIKMIQNHKTMKVDVGKVNDRYFANVIAGGMFSDISFQVPKNEKEKFGPLAYYATGIRQLPEQLHTSLHLKIITENETFLEEAKLFMVTNTSQVGGFKDIVPDASVSDGQMDLLIIRDCSTTDFISVLKDYALQDHQNSPFVRYIQAKNMTIECQEDIIYDVDGEEGHEFPIHVSAIPNALNIFVP